MEDDTLFSENELERIDKALVKFQLMYKTNHNPGERAQLERKIHELKASRGKLLYLLERRKREQEEKQPGEGKSNYLEIILGSARKKNYIGDEEINTLCLYVYFLDDEFLPVFSERQMKLDFKYSLERDNFHHRFQDLVRRLEDYLEELGRLKAGSYNKQMEIDFRHRNFQKKRNLLIEANRFFLRLKQFTLDILSDLNGSELICLNGDDAIRFELSEEPHFLEGTVLRAAFLKLFQYIDEVIGFINLPETE